MSKQLFDKEKTEFLNYNELQKLVQAAGIDSKEKYNNRQKNHPDWPSHPSTHYKNWISWYDLFGKKKKEFLSYSELQKLVQEAGIHSQEEYNNEQNNHPSWPSHPSTHYKEWISWTNLFGRKTKFITYDELKQALQEAGIHSQEEYNNEQKNHPDWPSHPSRQYKEWISWPYLLYYSK